MGVGNYLRDVLLSVLCRGLEVSFHVSDNCSCLEPMNDYTVPIPTGANRFILSDKHPHDFLPMSHSKKMDNN